MYVVIDHKEGRVSAPPVSFAAALQEARDWAAHARAHEAGFHWTRNLDRFEVVHESTVAGAA